jgi:aryl-alcohol dehydrogenase-like predicted oxidoreductase
MRYRRFGRTGFEVSQISLGTVEIGMDYGIASSRPDESEAARLLHRALDLGVNFIDTARVYGEAEAIIGRAIATRREEFVLVSKVVSFDGEGLTTDQLRTRVRDSVHESLRLLRTDFIDILMIHSAPLPVIQRGDVLSVLQELKREGSIRSIGASVYGEETALAAIDAGGYDCLQIAFNVLDRRLEERLFAAAHKADVGLVARSVLLKGALTERYRHLPQSLSDLKAVVERISQLAGGGTAGLPELAYRYALSQPWLQSALVGAGSIAELEAAVRFEEMGPLSPEMICGVRDVPIPDPFYLNPGNWPPS